MSRKRLATFGPRGAMIRLFEERRGAVRKYVVQWGPKDARQQQGYPATKAGRAEAEAFMRAFEHEASRIDAPAIRLTTRALWTAYVAAESEHLRPNTRRLYADAWRTWEQFIGADTIAEDVSIVTIHEFRQALDQRGLATATVQDCIRNVRIVYNWAERMELIARNRWHLFVYKVSKEKRTRPRAEYRADEFLAIWRAADPTKRSQWRAWVAIGLLGIYGNRQNEILNLQWPWIAGDVATIDPAVVKTGDESVLTLFPLTHAILAVAMEWRQREGYAGPYVLPPGQSPLQRQRGNASDTPHYTIQSLNAAIHRLERAAGVPTIRWRAGHGFRRLLVGDLVHQTGNAALALQAVGDRDPKMLKHYNVRRNDQIADAVQERVRRMMPDGLDRSDPERATKVQPIGGNDESRAESAASISNTDNELC